jgi:hypothetical protein
MDSLLELYYLYSKRYLTVRASNFADIPIEFFIAPLEKAWGRPTRVVVVRNVTPDIHFFSVFGDRQRAEQSTSQSKIFFTGECVSPQTKKSEFAKYGDHLLEYCKLSIGFECRSEDNYIRFPLWLLYYFRLSDSLDEVDAKVRELNSASYEKKDFCALVARDDPSGLRGSMYRELSAIAEIKCPSLLLHNDDSLRSVFGNNKIEYLKDFKFNICPENAPCAGYVTEKLFQAFEAGCIPIYAGWNSDPEPGIVNRHSFLWWGENEGEAVVDVVRELNGDTARYEAFRRENTPFLPSAPDEIFSLLQMLSNRLEEIAEDHLRAPL